MEDLFSQAKQSEEGYTLWKAEVAAAKSRMPKDDKHSQLSLVHHTDEAGHTAWQQERRREAAAYARHVGLPLGQRVRVTLIADGPELEGLLLHDDDHRTGGRSGVYLRLGSSRFHSSDIATVLRLD
jgi:hypothetical protein